MSRICMAVPTHTFPILNGGVPWEKKTLMNRFSQSLKNFNAGLPVYLEGVAASMSYSDVSGQPSVKPYVCKLSNSAMYSHLF